MGEERGFLASEISFSFSSRPASVPCAAAAERSRRARQPRVRRTTSLDAVLGSYLLGQWPRDPEGAAASRVSHKATQVPTRERDGAEGTAEHPACPAAAACSFSPPFASQLQVIPLWCRVGVSLAPSGGRGPLPFLSTVGSMLLLSPGWGPSPDVELRLRAGGAPLRWIFAVQQSIMGSFAGNFQLDSNLHCPFPKCSCLLVFGL